jgi:hypothetical protein
MWQKKAYEEVVSRLPRICFWTVSDPLYKVESFALFNSMLQDLLHIKEPFLFVRVRLLYSANHLTSLRQIYDIITIKVSENRAKDTNSMAISKSAPT